LKWRGDKQKLISAIKLTLSKYGSIEYSLLCRDLKGFVLRSLF